MKILINDCYGGFGLSTDVKIDLFELGYFTKIENPDLIIDAENSRIITNDKPIRIKEIKNGFYTEIRFGGYKFYKDDSTYTLPNDFCTRTNKDLISIFEKKGSEYCSGGFSELKLIEIPDDIKYTIEEYDGIEHIAEVHRTWS